MKKVRSLLRYCALHILAVVALSSCDNRIKYDHYISSFVDADTCLLAPSYSGYNLSKEEASSFGIDWSLHMFSFVMQDSMTRFSLFRDGNKKYRDFLNKIGDVRSPIVRGPAGPRDVEGLINTPEHISITCDRDFNTRFKAGDELNEIFVFRFLNNLLFIASGYDWRFYQKNSIVHAHESEEIAWALASYPDWDFYCTDKPYSTLIGEEVTFTVRVKFKEGKTLSASKAIIIPTFPAD